MEETALFSGKIYTADKNFTRPPVAAVATNFKSDYTIIKVSNNRESGSQQSATLSSTNPSSLFDIPLYHTMSWKEEEMEMVADIIVEEALKLSKRRPE